MNLKEHTISYGLIAACILGIVIVGAFIFYMGGAITHNQGFSEVYFSNFNKLPTVVSENEPIHFSFDVASHNKGLTDYTYTVYSGDRVITSGSFTLPKENAPNVNPDNRYNKTISIDNIRLKSTLKDLGSPQVSTTTFNFNGRTGFLTNSYDNDTYYVKSSQSQIYYPFRLPGSGNTITPLVFDPAKDETLFTTTTSTTNVGDISTIGQNAAAVEINGQRISNVGYDELKSDWIIKNNHGVITATANTTTVQHRYAFEKISVEVFASPQNNPNDRTRYEIHFWVVVTP